MEPSHARPFSPPHRRAAASPPPQGPSVDPAGSPGSALPPPHHPNAHTPQGARSTTADDAVSTAHRTTPHHYRDVVGTTVSDSRSGRALTHQQSENTTRAPHAPGRCRRGSRADHRRHPPAAGAAADRRRPQGGWRRLEPPGTAWNRLEPCDIAGAAQPPDARRFERAAPPPSPAHSQPRGRRPTRWRLRAPSRRRCGGACSCRTAAEARCANRGLARQ